jgi:glycosyltransferase involved in cell wall biosynthesis
MNSFAVGGTEGQAILLANALHRWSTWHVSLAVLEDSGPLRTSVAPELLTGLRVFPLRSLARMHTVRQVRTLAAMLVQSRVHVVHTWGFYPNIIGMVAARSARVQARISSKRESVSFRSASKSRLERLAFACATDVICNGSAIRDSLLASGVRADRVHLVPNGVHVGIERPTVKTDANVTSSSCGAFVLRVTMVANFHHATKDHETLVRAAARVVAENPNVEFVLAGEGPRLGIVMRLAEALGIDSHVRFPGRCEDVPSLLHESDVCVLSSVSEGFSNAILEYMAAGRAVVAADVAGVRDAVVDRVTGMLIPPGNIVAMANAIITLLGNGPLRQSMGAAARDVVVGEFSLERQLERTTAIYAGALARGSRNSV